MKGKNVNISTHIFNLRLFLEGLKRLRVIGLATAILALTATALVPIANGMEYADSYYDHHMDTRFLCVPVGIMVFLAPLFFFVLFSFLQKRKESDFFHAIPYTRTCVYISFVTAALVFVWAIQAACGLIAGILWSMIPRLIFDLGGMIAYVFICMLAAAMLSSFMMLARSVSGTSGSCMLLFALFAGFTRVVVGFFGGCLDSIALISSTDMWSTSFFAVCWFLPLNVISYLGDPMYAPILMYSLPNILYSIVVTLAVYTLAGFIYKHRKSEMAGNPAPGVRTQTLFRVMFTLIPALLIPMLRIWGENDATLHLVLVVVVLLTYFLYELITTKRPRNMIKAAPGLGFVAVGCILFALVFYGYRAVVLYEDIDTDDIKTVSVESDMFGYNTYQGHVIDDFQTDNPEIVELIADQLAYSQRRERGNKQGGSSDYNRRTVTICLKGGRTIERYIMLTQDKTNQIMDTLREEDEMRKLLYQLPANTEIDNGDMYISLGKQYSDSCYIGYSSMKELMAVFRAEFNSLTDEQKDRVMAPTFLNSNWSRRDEGITLQIQGTVNYQYFSSRYCITEDMPRTREHLLIFWSLESNSRYDNGNESWRGEAEDVLKALHGDLNDNPLKYVTVSIQAVSPRAKSWNDRTYELSISVVQLKELVTLLRERDLMNSRETKRDPYENVRFTDDTYCLHMTVQRNKQETDYLYVYINGLFDLSAEDWDQILEPLRN